MSAAAHLPDAPAYAARLRDGRRVYLAGERIADVTAHPAMRAAVRSIGRLYEALHDPEASGTLLRPSDTSPGRATHAAFVYARSADDLAAQRDAIASWARLTYGWMGRSPDYKAALTNTLGADPGFYGPFADNARRWYARAQAELPFLGHAIADPPVDRGPDGRVPDDIAVRVERETDAGPIVSGAKVVATSAAIATHCFVGQHPGSASDDPARSISFILPVDTPGLSLICRPSYELAASRHGGPFDHPLSSRFDENDAILVLDRVLVPWEDVLIHADPARSRRFLADSGFLNGFLFHGCVRLAVKLGFIAALLARALRVTGGWSNRGKRAMLGEVIAWRHAMSALADAMALRPDRWSGDAVLPAREAALAYCVLAPDCYPHVRGLVERAVGSGLIYLPAGAADLASAEVEPLLRRYARGGEGVDHRERIKVMKLLWDAIGTEFGARHELYERSYAGGWECIRAMVAGEAAAAGRLGAMDELVQRCLDDYDEHGFVDPAWRFDERPARDAA